MRGQFCLRKQDSLRKTKGEFWFQIYRLLIADVTFFAQDISVNFKTRY